VSGCVWAEHVVRMGVVGNPYTVLIRKPERKIPVDLNVVGLHVK
jgi:hypothetical protein